MTVCGAVLLVAAGCASPVPESIHTPPAGAFSVAEVQTRPANFVGQRVRWGGNILAVQNRARMTEIEVLSRPLSSRGEPRAEASSQGRFIAQVDGFLEPNEFPQQRMFTVTGDVVGTEKRLVGEYSYTYPIVQAEAYHLWPKPVEDIHRGHPWYDPWYSPWGWRRPGPYWW